MSRKVSKLIIVLVVVAIIAGVGVGLYFHYNQGPIIGRIQFGQKYYLTEIRDTERFAGATISRDSYFQINPDKQTGKLCLVGLTATTTTNHDGTTTTAAIPFIVTNYKEGVKNTVIDFEYIIDNGEKTQIQHLQAISNNSEIRIKAVEPHNVQVIQQNPDKNLTELNYAVTILVFAAKEAE